MSLDMDRVLDALEGAALLLPDLAGRVEHFWASGVGVRVTWDSDPFANLVGAATLDEDNADGVISEVRGFFAEQGKAFGWLVGPRSTPADLVDRLTWAGFTNIGEFAGMLNCDPGAPLRTNPEVYVWEAGPDDFETAGWLMAEGMGVAQEQTRAVTEALFFGESPLNRRVYFANLEGVDYPVGFASMVYVPEQPLVHLASAATLEDFRGQGIYTALLARRLADAHGDGAQAAIIHANRTTSAPICRRHGFAEIANLVLMAWYP